MGSGMRIDLLREGNATTRFDHARPHQRFPFSLLRTATSRSSHEPLPIGMKSFCSCLATPSPPSPCASMALAGEALLLLCADPHFNFCIVRIAKVIPDPRRGPDPARVMLTLFSARRLLAMSVESDRFLLTSSSTSH